MIERRSLQVRLKKVMIVILAIIPVVLIIIMLSPALGGEQTAEFPASPDPAKSLIEQHSSVKVLKAVQYGDEMRISYELTPRIFTTNESIHDDKMFNIICALRQNGPVSHTYVFSGMRRFYNDYGQLVHRASVVSSMAAGAINRINCRGDLGRVNWRNVSLSYSSHPVPDGLQKAD